MPDLLKKLQTEDKSAFRVVMETLKYEGKDPTWHKLQEIEEKKYNSEVNSENLAEQK